MNLNNYKQLETVANNYLNGILRDNKNLINDTNFSLIQYSNQTVLKLHIKASINTLDHLDKDKSYLNVGMGGGFLELVAKQRGGYNIESIEWDQQEPIFRPLRVGFDVDNYLIDIVGDINSDEFTINTDKHYDYVILSRFFPINKKWAGTEERFWELINKFKQYADGVIIFDAITNFNKDWLKDFEIYSMNESKGFTLFKYNFMTSK